MKLLEAEEKTKLLEAEEKKARMYDKEEAEKNRMFELEKTRIDVNSLHILRKGVGVKENTIESQMVRSLKAIPEFDEKVTKWFRRFEKKAAEFYWPQERWVGLVANIEGQGIGSL